MGAPPGPRGPRRTWQINAPGVTTHNLSVSGLSLPDSSSLNYIRFKVTELGVGEVLSPNFPLKVDVTPPAAPQNLSADPSVWTNAESFTVTWTNPYDVSPVVGAWYKLDSPPSSANDGVYVSSTNAISGIKPAADGEHKIYVWLQDGLWPRQPRYGRAHEPLRRSNAARAADIHGRFAGSNLNQRQRLLRKLEESERPVGHHGRLLQAQRAADLPPRWPVRQGDQHDHGHRGAARRHPRYVCVACGWGGQRGSHGPHRRPGCVLV